MKNKNLFDRTGIKSLRSFLRNKATSSEVRIMGYFKIKTTDGDPRWIKSQSTTPAANRLGNILTIIILRCLPFGLALR